jgi:hypothetical protein
LRNLVASMLKKKPEDRPSLNTILRKGFVRKIEEGFIRSKATQNLQQIRIAQSKRAQSVYNRRTLKSRRNSE